MYYFKILDCERIVFNKFGYDMPRVETLWSIRTRESLNYEDENWSEFSYEDSSQYSLYFWMWVIMTSMMGLLARAYYKHYQVHEKMCTPHPIILGSLAFATGSLFFECVHCWVF